LGAAKGEKEEEKSDQLELESENGVPVASRCLENMIKIIGREDV